MRDRKKVLVLCGKLFVAGAGANDGRIGVTFYGQDLSTVGALVELPIRHRAVGVATQFLVAIHLGFGALPDS